MWDEFLHDYKFVKENVDQDFRDNFMSDPLWTQYDFQFIGW